MSWAGELQTISAVLDLLQLAWKAGVFLNEVKNAHRIAGEVCEQVELLTKVLEGVQSVLLARQRAGVKAARKDGSTAENRIEESVKACRGFLEWLQSRVGDFDTTSGAIKSIVERFKLVCRQPSIARRQADLDARISILQTELVVLQLLDQTSTQSTIQANQSELLRLLSNLSRQVESGHKSLGLLFLQQRIKPDSTGEDKSKLAACSLDAQSDDKAAESLAECLRNARDVHERYTSEYLPDDRSLRYQGKTFSPKQIDSMSRPATPASEAIDHSQLSKGSLELGPSLGPNGHDVDAEEDVWPLEVLDMHIAAYRNRAEKERDAEHFKQAEFNLTQAITHSEVRERHYNVPFLDRVAMQEEIASLSQKQGKWGEAVAKVHQLMNSSGPVAGCASDVDMELVQARQNHLLASIYFDRHLHNSGPALSKSTADAENAERHARRAFNKRFAKQKAGELSAEQLAQHDACINLLVRILEVRDKIVEANELNKLLSDSSSLTSESLRRISTALSCSAPDDELAKDKYDILIDAIKSADADQIQAVLATRDVDIERLCQEKKTPLMHAVEQQDESTIHRLLDPAVGANVDTANKQGLTALHIAAGTGLHEMVRCLIHHDAEIEAKDRRFETPLTKAVKAGHSVVVQLLYDSGANLLTKDIDEWSLLHHAISREDTAVTKALLELEPQLAEAVDQAGKTALHYCAELEYLDQAKALLENANRLDVHATDSSSRTPLYFAASKPSTPRREDMVRLLVKHGAQVDATRPPPRFRDYASLRSFMEPRREAALKKRNTKDSVSTEGSVGTTSTGISRISRVFSARMSIR